MEWTLELRSNHIFPMYVRGLITYFKCLFGLFGKNDEFGKDGANEKLYDNMGPARLSTMSNNYWHFWIPEKKHEKRNHISGENIAMLGTILWPFAHYYYYVNCYRCLVYGCFCMSVTIPICFTYFRTTNVHVDNMRWIFIQNDRYHYQMYEFLFPLGLNQSIISVNFR